MSRPEDIMSNAIIHQIIDAALDLAESGINVDVDIQCRVSWHETPVITVGMYAHDGVQCNLIWMRNYSPDDEEYRYTPAELLAVLEQIRDAGFRMEEQRTDPLLATWQGFLR